jgi:two-component system chemotaxis response regulator CheY
MSKILIVDDSQFVRSTIKQMLISKNQEIIGEAADGIEAVEKYKQLHPDLVIMDIMMPKKNGLEAMKDIQQYDQKCKIVVCSSLHQDEIMKTAKKLGALAYLFKPFEIKKLMNIIHQI